MDNADALRSSEHHQPPLLYDPEPSSKNYIRRIPSNAENKKRIKGKKNQQSMCVRRSLVKNIQIPKADYSLKDFSIKVNNDFSYYTPLFIKQSQEIDYPLEFSNFYLRVKHQQDSNSLINLPFRLGPRQCHICQIDYSDERKHVQGKEHKKRIRASKPQKYIRQLVDRYSKNRINKLIENAGVPKINKQRMKEIIVEENIAKEMKKQRKKQRKRKQKKVQLHQQEEVDKRKQKKIYKKSEKNQRKRNAK